MTDKERIIHIMLFILLGVIMLAPIFFAPVMR